MPVVQSENYLSHFGHVVGLIVKLLDNAVESGGDLRTLEWSYPLALVSYLYRCLVRLYLAYWVKLFDPGTGLDKPLDDLTFRDAY